MNEDENEDERSEDDVVEAWRLETLLEAGYPMLFAQQLAVRSDVDLHQAVALVENGCPTATAVRILA